MLFAAKEVKEVSWIVLARTGSNLVVLAGPVCSVPAPESGSEYFAESESNPDPDPYQSFFISVADPGSVAFLTPRSGIGFFRIPDLGSRIPNHIFESLVTKFLVKKLAQIFFHHCKK